MKKFDVIALGIAVMDILATPVDKSVFERENTTIDTMLLTPGGDAANQSVHLAKLGMRTALCCRVGRDSLGAMFLDMIAEAGVDLSLAAVSFDSVTSAAIALVASSGARNIIYRRGNNFDFCIDDIDMDALKETRALSIGSLYGMPKLEDDGLLEVIETAARNGAIIFSDMASDKKGLRLGGVLPFLPHIDYFMPSEAESTHLTGQPDCREAAQTFIDAGAKNVIIKLGGRGVYAHCKDYQGFFGPYRIAAKDTTGAGDAFCAGFVRSVLSGADITQALAFASACGAFNSLYLGAAASPISMDAIGAFMAAAPRE